MQISGVNIIDRKVSVTSVSGVLRLPIRVFRGQSSLRKPLGYKEYVDWLKIDLNVAEIITVQDYKQS